MRNKEWIKKTMAMMVTATMLTSISGCASKSNGVELSDTTVVAEVAEVDGNVDRAILLAGGAHQSGLVDGHVGGQGGLLGDDEVILGQLLADAGLAHALLE